MKVLAVLVVLLIAPASADKTQFELDDLWLYHRYNHCLRDLLLNRLFDGYPFTNPEQHRQIVRNTSETCVTLLEDTVEHAARHESKEWLMRMTPAMIRHVIDHVYNVSNECWERDRHAACEWETAVIHRLDVLAHNHFVAATSEPVIRASDVGLGRRITQCASSLALLQHHQAENVNVTCRRAPSIVNGCMKILKDVIVHMKKAEAAVPPSIVTFGMVEDILEMMESATTWCGEFVDFSVRDAAGKLAEFGRGLTGDPVNDSAKNVGL